MRQSMLTRTSSLASDLGSLAGLYRTVFWMIGRKSQYGRIWPREADMGPNESLPVPPPAPLASFEVSHTTAVQAGVRD